MYLLFKNTVDYIYNLGHDGHNQALFRQAPVVRSGSNTFSKVCGDHTKRDEVEPVNDKIQKVLLAMCRPIMDAQSSVSHHSYHGYREFQVNY